MTSIEYPAESPAELPVEYPAGGVTVLRPVLRHDRDALTKIWWVLMEIMAPIDAVLWLISPHPALSNKHPIWCQADEVRALLDGATHDELLAQAKIAAAKVSA